MIKTVALPVRPVVEVDLEFWVRNFDSVAMDVESYAATFCHRLCSNCVRMSYLSPFACRSRNGNSKVAMDVFQRQLLILAKQPYRFCKFSVHVLLRITSAVTESPPTDYDFETRAIGDFGSPLGYPPLFDAGECQQ